MTIRQKLIMLLVLAALVIASISGWHIYEHLMDAEKEAIVNAESVALALGTSMTFVDESTDIPPLYKSPSGLKDFIYDRKRLLTDIEDFVVVDINRVILGDATQEEVGKSYDDEHKGREVELTIKDGATRTFIEKSAGHHPDGVRQLVVPLRTEEGETVGAIIMEYTAYYNKYTNSAKREAWKAVIVAAFSLLIAIGGGYYISSGITGNIARLKKATEDMAGGNLDVKVEVESKDELGDLAAAFNSMAALRKAAEEAVKESKERYSDLFENVNDLVQCVTADGLYVYVNAAWRRTLGYSEEEVNKLTIMDVIHRDSMAHCMKIFQRLMAGEEVGTCVAVFKSKDGRAITVEGNINCKFENGKPVYTRGIFRDITERKRAEEALRVSEERFRTVTEFAGDAIIGLKSPDTVYLWNKRAEEIFGYTTDEAMGKNMHDLIVPERYHEKALAGLSTFFRTGTGPVIGKTLEIEALRRNGEEFPVELSISAINIEEEWRAIGIVRDITERRQLQQDIEKSNKELQDFAYIVSHDLKAPLRAIGTITSWLAEDYKDKLDDAGREQLDLLLNRTQRMHGMIEGILHYSRAGRVMGEPVLVEIGKVVRQVIDALAPPENIRITVKEPLPDIIIDPLKISQVFQNLISNAVKYMDKPEGLIDIGCTDTGDLWEFHVKDNGPGIEERHFERIFQIFQTLKPRDEFESTGIGLTIVKKIIEQNGGRIWVESEVGKGSTFKFTLRKG